MANTIPSSSSLSVDLQATEVKKTSVTVTDKSGQTTSTETVDAVSVNISATLQSGSEAHHPDRLERGKARFDRLDTDKGGDLTKDELVALKQDRNSRGIKTPGLDHLINNFSTIDQNGDGNISKSEFHTRPIPAGQQNQPPAPPPAESAPPAETSLPASDSTASSTSFDFSNLQGSVVLGKVFQGFSSTEPISTSSSSSSSNSSSSSSSDASTGSTSQPKQTAIIDYNAVLAPVVGSILGAATKGDSALTQAVQSYLAFKSDAQGTENQNLQKYDLDGKV